MWKHFSYQKKKKSVYILILIKWRKALLSNLLEYKLLLRHFVFSQNNLVIFSVTLSFLHSLIWIFCCFFIQPTKWTAPILQQQNLTAFNVFILTTCVWCWIALWSYQLGAVVRLLNCSQLVNWARVFQIPCWWMERCAIPLDLFKSQRYLHPLKGSPSWVLVLGALLFLTPNLRNLGLLFRGAMKLQLTLLSVQPVNTSRMWTKLQIASENLSQLTWHSVYTLNHWQE